MPLELEQRLRAAALKAMAQAHAPYSGFAVGAVVLDEHGVIHAGCNVENAAYPQGWCAETGALAAMVLSGARQVRAVLVTSSGTEAITPCGGCRQKLREFASDDVPVIGASVAGIQGRWTLGELLPASFSAAHLQARNLPVTQPGVADAQIHPIRWP